MKSKHSEIAVILDRSGSMSTVVTDTIGGFNAFLEEQKKVEGTANFTLVQFDNQYQIDHDGVDIKSVEPLTTKTYQPRGSTALYDAIGRTINSIGKRLDAMPESEKPEKVIIVIQTDGEENSSREFDSQAINKMITHQQEKYNWEFVFVGADQDAIMSARDMGINTANAMTYAKNAKGSHDLYRSLSSNMTQMRCGVKATMAFTPEDYSKQADAGANQ